MDKEKQIIAIIAEQLERDVDGITRESKFLEDLNLDDLDVMEITMELEDEFDISIEETIDSFETVNDMIEIVERKLA